MKNNGSALLRESDTTFNKFPLGSSVLIVDRDRQSLQEIEAILRGSGYEVTKCDRVEDASAWLWMKGSVFDIIIIEQCLLGVNEFELLRIGKHMVLPVILTFKDDQLNIVQWSLVNGTCEYQLKLIPMSVLNVVSECMLFKKNNEWAQVQQPANNVSRERNQRMSWTLDSHEKFVECVQKLGGAKKATPRKILRLLRSIEGFEDVDREKVSSHLQKYRDRLKKEAQPPMTVANEPDILSQQQQAPAAKNTQGFQSVTRPFETNVPTIGGSTSCGNQSNGWMTQMDASSSEQMQNQSTGGQPFDWENIFNDPAELPSLDTFQGGISGGPGFYYNNAPLLGPFHTDHGEHGCSPGWNS